MPRKYISKKVRKKIQILAKDRCEYCKCMEKYSPTPFTIDHIISLFAGGNDEIENLAFSCGGCNEVKHIKDKGLDEVTGELVALFNPRKQIWDNHFKWDEDYLTMIGITATGRATITIQTLKLNRYNVVEHRRLIKMSKEHPA